MILSSFVSECECKTSLSSIEAVACSGRRHRNTSVCTGKIPENISLIPVCFKNDTKVPKIIRHHKPILNVNWICCLYSIVCALTNVHGCCSSWEISISILWYQKRPTFALGSALLTFPFSFVGGFDYLLHQWASHQPLVLECITVNVETNTLMAHKSTSSLGIFLHLISVHI